MPHPNPVGPNPAGSHPTPLANHTAARIRSVTL